MIARIVSGDNRQLSVVQAGRGIAALLVVIYHATSMFALPKYGAHEVWAGWGEVGKHGVDFFFVLSGFIIYFAHRNDLGRPQALSYYLWKRFIRIYPIYWFYLTLFLLLVLLGFGTAEVSSRPIDLVSAYSLIRLSPEKPPLWVAWTLFHEVLFYAVMAILIVHRRAGLFVMVLWLCLIAVMHESRGPVQPSFASVVYDAINLEFFMGIAVALLYERINSKAAVACIAAGVLVLLGVTAYDASASFADAAATTTLFYGLGSALVLVGLIVGERNGFLRASRIAKALGDATFTIYLAHSMLLSIGLRFLARVAAGHPFAGEILPLVLTCGAVAICYVLYRFIERPLLRSLSGMVSGGRAVRVTASGFVAPPPAR